MPSLCLLKLRLRLDNHGDRRSSQVFEDGLIGVLTPQELKYRLLAKAIAKIEEAIPLQAGPSAVRSSAQEAQETWNLAAIRCIAVSTFSRLLKAEMRK